VGRCRDLLVSQLPDKPRKSVLLLIKLATYQSGLVCLFLQSLLCPVCKGPVWKPTIVEPARGWKKWTLAKRHLRGKSHPSHGPLYRGRGHTSDVCGLPHNYGHALKMPAGLMLPFEELCIRHCGKEEKAWLASTAGSSTGHSCSTTG